MDNHIEKDKFISAFLMTREDVRFIGTEVQDGVVYFKFSPEKQAREYVDQYLAGTALPVQPKVFVEAISTVTRLIWRNKPGYGNGEKYGGYR